LTESSIRGKLQANSFLNEVFGSKNWKQHLKEEL